MDNHLYTKGGQLLAISFKFGIGYFSFWILDLFPVCFMASMFIGLCVFGRLLFVVPIDQARNIASVVVSDRERCVGSLMSNMDIWNKHDIEEKKKSQKYPDSEEKFKTESSYSNCIIKGSITSNERITNVIILTLNRHHRM